MPQTRSWPASTPSSERRRSAVRGPVCILAGAGTGKTRAITHRIAYAVRSGAVPAGQLLAVTFTARAAGELRSRLRRLGADGVQARTFHAAALRQLAYFAPRVLGGAMPEVVDNPLRLVGNAAAPRVRLRADRTELRDLAAEIEWAKAVLVDAGRTTRPRRAAAGREPPTTAATRSPPSTPSTRQAKRRVGQLDFADLLLIMAGAIEEMPDVAEEIRSRYRHFVVDEYQDVSPLQQRLLDAWLGGRDDLCVVGDAEPDDLLLRRGDTRAPARLPPPLPGRRGRPAGSGLPLDAAGRGAGEPARRAGPGAVATAAAAAGRPAPGRARSRPSPSTTTSRPRPPTVAARVPRA